MRPIATDQDCNRYPLNELLGTRANVRLLRLLADEVSAPVSVPEAAEHTGLTEAGARRALERLAKTGFVVRLGAGRLQAFQMRDSDPVLSALRSLFEAERNRYQSLISQLQLLFQSFPEVQVAWIDDSRTEAEEPLHVGVLADARSVSYLNDQVRQRLIVIEGDFDVTIEVLTFARADAPEVAWQSATLLAGYVPESRPESKTSGQHSDRMERANMVSEAISDMLDRDPSLKRRAEKHLDLLLERSEGAAVHDIREWRDILRHYSRQRLKEFVVSESPRAQRLRQSSPFFAVLTSEEREELQDLVEGKNDA